MSHEDYYYVNPSDIDNDRLLIRDREFHHLINVSRKRANNLFYAVDGKGRWFECELIRVGAQQAEARILQLKQNVAEPKFELTLAQAPPKGSRFDIVVEKGTEIGVCRFVPMQTERSVATATGKVERWRRIALAAMKQCGRSVWPEVTDVMPFKGVLERFREEEVRLIAHEGEMTSSLGTDWMESLDSDLIRYGVILVGPEGGFTDTEIQFAEDFGFLPMGLSPRRLRSETAGIVAATLVLSYFGELQ